ncbi:hypothetical protein QAD02_008504 [Eretmocerus hayati]|uniref:Uncharacterized protein n=1 Tax=Eretmocerus hayati TaxID=131215 RepID=A0ACC2N6Q2_9HYME|nr:hypothetical protein QAD02_008504 [Eretmocerus hayati]
MVGRAFSVRVDLDVHAITCPGVWLCTKGKVALQIHIFDSCVATRRLTPVFPLLYHDKFTFKKVFFGVTTLANLQKKLSEESIFADLVQWSPTTNKNVSLASFETNLADLLYPEPCFKGLLAGVDVDLLMEPSKLFPGILSPKIEISTRTTVEEAAGSDFRPSGGRIINPKLVNSLNQPCVHRRNEPPANGIIRQKKVCHSRQKKQTTYLCRMCRQKQANGECGQDRESSERPSSQNDGCYLSSSCKERRWCHCSDASSRKSRENLNICNDAHILDSCPVCLRYKCFFPNKKTGVTCNLKVCRDARHENPCEPHGSNEPRAPSIGASHESCKTYNTRTSDASPAFYSKSEAKSDRNAEIRNNKCYKYCQTEEEKRSEAKFSKRGGFQDDQHCKSSRTEEERNLSISRCKSVPSLKEDITTSYLLAKMKQLERTKEQLNYAKNKERCLDHTHSNEDIQNNEIQKGFYTNMKKFYKRMYRQAKERAQNIG